MKKLFFVLIGTFSLMMSNCTKEDKSNNTNADSIMVDSEETNKIEFKSVEVRSSTAVKMAEYTEQMLKLCILQQDEQANALEAEIRDWLNTLSKSEKKEARSAALAMVSTNYNSIFEYLGVETLKSDTNMSDKDKKSLVLLLTCSMPKDNLVNKMSEAPDFIAFLRNQLSQMKTQLENKTILITPGLGI